MARENSKLQAFVEDFLPSISAEEKELAQAIYSDFPIVSLKEIGESPISKTLSSCLALLQERQAGQFKINVNHLDGEDEYNVIEVIGDDITFLVESISNELRQQNYNVHYVIHDTVPVKRDKDGKLISFSGDNKEVVMQFFISYYAENEQHAQLKQRLLKVAECVAYAVDGWHSMRDKMQEAITGLKKANYTEDQLTKNETLNFLDWLVNNNFIFLGFAKLDFVNNKITQQKDSALGILKSSLYSLDLTQAKIPAQGESLNIRKSEYRSVVHRTSNMDILAIAEYKDKKQIGIFFFFGFFTSSVYYQSVRNIPLMRSKVNNVLARYGYPESSYNAKELVTAIEAFPRGELLQVSENELYEIATEIVSLGLIPRVRIFIRRDVMSNFLSCLIFIPKNKFSTAVVNLVEKTIEQELHGKIARQYLQVGEPQLARLQFIVKVPDAATHIIDIEHIEKLIIDATSSWDENLHKELLIQLPRQRANSIFDIFCGGFNVKYTSAFNPTQALIDIRYIEESMQDGKVRFDISSDISLSECPVHLRVYTADKELPLSSTLPVIEALGFYAQDVVIHEVKLAKQASARSAFIHIFHLYVNDREQTCIEITPARKKNLEELLSRVWNGKIEDDRFNSLALLADLHWQEVIILRAYAKYIKQLSFPFAQDYIIEALINNREICRDLMALFSMKFALNQEVSTLAVEDLQQKIINSLAEVQNLAEDKVLRMYLQVIMATKRTNFYQHTTDNQLKDYVSFKIKSGELTDIPLPKPGMEIFVYSPRFEAVHLRGVDVAQKQSLKHDKQNSFHIVARGGLRWSDRSEDFRTEVLGLLKAQMTKNAIIVPVGSKGGFVLKKLSSQASRDEVMSEGIECYQTFLRGMLDITDNIIAGYVIPPAQVVRHDGNDPYLVVAADKGTATFSDYANQVAAEYNFWLGDAFASGGSAGYDHKKMGITAKGAWVSVEKHFAELGLDIYNQPFTVVGVGDMSGDVFGNGMLLSPQIKLVAAFNHMHIFLDPNPDVAISYAERQRLFNLPRSQWSDYNPELISTGGGVFSRKAKSIALSPQMQARLGVSAANLSPDELIKAILTAPVDLLWNGGIGTYIKASYEANENIGDKTNDSLRINGNALRCRVLAEGGNLGCTQRGRIEYAMNGGRINTDFIDNSAGVDCSDHEVNIKIAFTDIMASQKLSISERNEILNNMTTEVERLVLLDNIWQNQLLTIEECWGKNRLEEHAWLIKQLEITGELDRQLECLPANDEISSLINNGSNLPRPSISVLAAYAKNSVYQKLCTHEFASDPFFQNALINYFPVQMRGKYREILLQHKLGNEIIATALTNQFINIMGCCCMHQVIDETSYSPKDIIKAFMLTMQVLQIDNLWQQVVELNAIVPVIKQVKLFRKLQEIILQGMMWLLRNTEISTLKTEDLDFYQQGMLMLQEKFSEVCSDDMQQAFEKLCAEHAKTPELVSISQKINLLHTLSAGFAIIKLAKKYNCETLDIARVYFHLGDKMQLNWLLSLIYDSDNYSYVERLALNNLALRINKLQGKLISRELKIRKELKEKGTEFTIDSIHFTVDETLDKYNEFIQELKANASNSLISTVTIAVARVHDMFLR